MSSSLVLTVKCDRSTTDVVSKLKKSTSSPREQALALSQYFHALASGHESASVDFQTAAAAPVRASQTLTLTYASIANNDTCVIAGTTLTCVTGTPSGFSEFKKETDATTTAANLVAAITGNTTLSKFVTASNVAGVVTITCRTPGTIGNTLTLVGSTGMVAGAATFASGAGGAETTQVSYSLGL